MKKMARILALTLSLFLLLSSTAFAEGLIENIHLEDTYPVVNDPVDVKIAFYPSDGSSNFDVENNWMITYFDNVTNLNIDWQFIDPTAGGAAGRERIMLLLNSGDMPDAIQGFGFTTDDLVQYGMGEGLFRPLNDLLDYTPQFSALLEERPTLRAALTCPDGNIYGFPALPNVNSFNTRFFINMKWLDNVGMEKPRTLAELKEVLTAFRDQDANGNGDPADEIPWSGAWSEAQPERGLIFLAMGLVNGGGGNVAINYSGEEPVITYVPYDPLYKEFLTYMNGLWTEGLLDQDMFTQSETQVQASVLDGIVGLCGMSAPYVYDPDHQEDWDASVAMVDQEGDTPVWVGPATFYAPAYFVISADADDETAAALANFADGYYSLETYAYATYGPEAETELDYFGWGHYYDPAENTILYNLHPNASGAWNHRTTFLTFWNVPGMVVTGYDPYRLAYAEKYPDSAIGQQFKDGVVRRLDEYQQIAEQEPYYVDGVPSFFFELDDLDRINELVTPLEDYVASMEAKFITGELSIETDYDNFISTLESYGVQEYVDIYTEYYEAYKANQ